MISMMNRNFAVFIVSGGRAGRVKTLRALEASGYKGAWYIVCDDEDKTLADYQASHPKKIIVFNKKHYQQQTDEMDNFGPGKVVVYARNACWDLAKKIGLTHFLVLDDDYTSFRFRFDESGSFGSWYVSDFDALCRAALDYLDETRFLSIALAQGGDYIGGSKSTKLSSRIAWRKVMNSFFCRTDRPFQFMGRINEDTNAYTVLGNRGKLFLTIVPAQLTQTQTQANAGGLTDAYLESGTYVKSFYTVMLAPSCCKVSPMGDGHFRLHHWIKWRDTVPHIIREHHRKARCS